MVGGLIAANSSTILTHLNWGASYLVHDFYRRFLSTRRTEHHYVQAGRLATVLLFLSSSCLVFVLRTAQDSFNIILQGGAGTGLLYLLRWFWWRVTAWCEIAAMVVSFGVSVGLLLLRRYGWDLGTHQALLVTVALTTLCWVLVAYFGPETDREVLIRFYRKVHPLGPGWRRVRVQAGITPEEAAAFARADNFPLALLGWFAGTVLILSALFTVGNFLYLRMGYGWGLLGISVVSGGTLIWVVRRIWN